MPRALKLKVAAKVDNADKKYYDNEIAPLIARSPWVEFIGEINDSQKPAFLSGAHALLFPIDWPEPFGLVMIESMACGTPVVAFNRGSVPEVIDDGLTGFIVHDEATAIQAVGRLERTRSHGWCAAVRSPFHRAPHGGGLPRSLYRAVRAANCRCCAPSGTDRTSGLTICFGPGSMSVRPCCNREAATTLSLRVARRHGNLSSGEDSNRIATTAGWRRSIHGVPPLRDRAQCT